MSDARKAILGIQYQSADITSDIRNDVLSLAYTDNAAFTADDISLSLRDNSRKWLERWKVEKGDKLGATIMTRDWRHEGDNRDLYCGAFNIDVPEYGGPPRVISLKGISTPFNSDFVTTRSKIWNKIGLETIAAEIAGKYGYTLFFDSARPRYYTTIEQKDQSDMDFLCELCQTTAHGFKVADGQIIIYDQFAYENKPPTITIREKHLESYNFQYGNDCDYLAVEVTYQDDQRGIMISGRYGDGDAKVHRITDQFVSSIADAEYLAKSKLFELNRFASLVNLTLPGDVVYNAGVCFNLLDFGFYNGKYFIDKVTHNIPGYTCNIEAHRALEGF